MEVHFDWIGGATFILTLGKLKIAIDPVLCPMGTTQDYFWFKSKRIENPIYRLDTFADIDLWLITHNHEDHLDYEGLKVIDKNTKVITNRNAYKRVVDNGNMDVSMMKWGASMILNIKGYRIDIEAIPAIHGINPLSALFAGKVNGYYLKIYDGNDEVRIYITSDTVYKRKVIDAMREKPIDILVPNMGAAKQGTWIMTLTLDSKMLTKMISIFNPKVVVPVHYGTFEHYHESGEAIRGIDDDRIILLEVGNQKTINL